MRVTHVRVMLIRVTLLRVMLVRVVLVRVMLVRVVGLYQAKHMVTNGPYITVLKSSSIRKCFNEEAQTKFEHCSGWYRPLLGIEIYITL